MGTGPRCVFYPYPIINESFHTNVCLLVPKTSSIVPNTIQQINTEPKPEMPR
jgi:hypothetical protein